MTEFEIRSADGTALFGLAFDPPESPKAVMTLVHGFGEHIGRYSHLAAYLKTQGIAVVGIDLRGHGRSAGKRGVCTAYEYLFDDLKALRAKSAELYPDLPEVLYGHSMGGGLVLNYVLSHGPAQLRAVIASAPLIAPADPPSRLLKTLVKSLARLAPGLALPQPISGEKISTLPEEQQAYENDPLVHGSMSTALARDIIEGGEWIAAEAENWHVPLLLLHARGDKLTAFVASEAFASKAKNCTFFPLNDAEHEIHNDLTRGTVYRAISTFISAQL